MLLRKISSALILVVYTFPAVAQEVAIAKDPSFWKLVPKDVKVEKMTSGFLFTEGPIWNKKDSTLLFSDIPANTIYRLSTDGKSKEFLKPSENSNGLTYDPQGNLVICEQFTKRIVRLDKDSKISILADNYNGKKFNSPNDIVFKKDGSFFFTDPPYGHMQFNKDKTREINFTGIYYVKNGKASLVDTMIRANGVCLSPDEKTLYMAQSEFKWVFKSYQINTDGMVSSSKIFFEGPEITGNPDGIKVDVDGNVYCTGSGGIMVFTKEGKLLGTVKIPENPANLAWGDPDFKSLYVTAQGSIYKIKVNTKGYSGY